MNTGKTVCAQLLEHLPLHQFRLCVKRYGGNHKVQSFTCLDQSVTNISQISYGRYPDNFKRIPP